MGIPAIGTACLLALWAANLPAAESPECGLAGIFSEMIAFQHNRYDLVGTESQSERISLLKLRQNRSVNSSIAVGGGRGSVPDAIVSYTMAKWRVDGGSDASRSQAFLGVGRSLLDSKDRTADLLGGMIGVIDERARLVFESRLMADFRAVADSRIQYEILEKSMEVAKAAATELDSAQRSLSVIAEGGKIEPSALDPLTIKGYRFQTAARLFADQMDDILERSAVLYGISPETFKAFDVASAAERLEYDRKPGESAGAAPLDLKIDSLDGVARQYQSKLQIQSQLDLWANLRWYVGPGSDISKPELGLELRYDFATSPPLRSAPGPRPAYARPASPRFPAPKSGGRDSLARILAEGDRMKRGIFEEIRYGRWDRVWSLGEHFSNLYDLKMQGLEMERSELQSVFGLILKPEDLKPIWKEAATRLP